MGVVVGVGSVRGSPGVSVLAALLASAWPGGGGVLVDADPAGGVTATRFGLGVEPGLLSAATHRHGLDAVELGRHLQEWGSARVLVGPQTAEQAGAALGESGPALVGALRGLDGGAVVDLGRLAPGSPAGLLTGACDRVVVVCRPRADEAWALAGRVAGLRAVSPEPWLAAVGEEPYRPAELAFELGVSLGAVLPVDPVSAGMLSGEVTVRPARLRRSGLWRAAVSLAESLAGSPAGVAVSS